MKRQILLLCFLLVSLAGFSQITKADATGFFTRNPEPNWGKIQVAANQTTLIGRYTPVSITVMDSGLSILYKISDGRNFEIFIPFSSINHLRIDPSGEEKNLVIVVNP